MQVVLTMVRAGAERRSFSILNQTTVIGRAPDCDLRVPLSNVSRKHCRLLIEGESPRIEDLGSSNGTFHNGRRVEEAVLSAGDRIGIGPVTFVVRIDGLPPEDQLDLPLQPAETAEQEPDQSDLVDFTIQDSAPVTDDPDSA